MRSFRSGVSVLVLVAANTASASTAEWRTITWDNFGREGAFLGVEENKLVLGSQGGPDGAEPGYAHYGTGAAFRGADQVSVSMTFEDDGRTGVGQSARLTEGFGRVLDMGLFTSADGADNFYGYQFQWVGLGTVGGGGVVRAAGARSLGAHTFTTVKDTDGMVQFFFDGQMVGETAGGRWDYVQDVYLIGLDPAGGLTEFTDYRAHVTGDTDGDDTVGLSDLNNVLNGFGGKGTGLTGDENWDGVVDLVDLNNVLNHFKTGAVGEFAVVPEGGVVWGGVAAVAALVGKRRR